MGPSKGNINPSLHLSIPSIIINNFLCETYL